MKRTSCGGCHESELIKFLDLGSSPLADEFPTERNAEQERFPLELYVCEVCKLVQLGEVVADERLFGDNYGFYSGTSKAILDYYQAYADWILAHEYGRDGLTVEIACNDGGLLKILQDAGHRVLGVDPATGPAKQAQEAGLPVVVKPFSVATAIEVYDTYGAADLIIANHVTAHVADLDDFLEGIGSLLSVNGRAILEVQYLPDLLTGNMLDHVYHEHRFFFSLRSLAAALWRQGLWPRRVEWVDRQGGSIRVVATRYNRSTGQSDHSSVAGMLHAEQWLTDWTGAYEGVQGRADRIKDRLLNLVADQNHRFEHLLAGYGAPAKATTLLSFCDLDEKDIHWVQDTTPSKQGRFMPGTNIPILSPGNEPVRPDTYLLFVWNYLAEILRKETIFTSSGGRFIVPIPFPMMV